MGEVLLCVVVDGEASAERAFAGALRGLRWEPVEAATTAWACPFEHGLDDEIRRILESDLGRAGRASGDVSWRALYLWSAEGHRRLVASAAGGGAAARGPWTDGGAPVGPLADVLVVLAEAALPEAFGRSLRLRGWARLEGFEGCWRHAYDLGMFEPLAPRVEADLAAAAHQVGLASVDAVWAHSTGGARELAHDASARVARWLPGD